MLVARLGVQVARPEVHAEVHVAGLGVQVARPGVQVAGSGVPVARLR